MTESSFTRPRSGRGTREWSEKSFNIGLGCSNDCLYCYARADKLRRKTIVDRAKWPVERLIKQADITRYSDMRAAVTMFPTTHDITPFYLPHFIRCARLILQGGNPLLIVSKPRFDCIKEVCAALMPWRKQIEFRFSIGTLSPEVSRFWEPGAPLPVERLNCLSFAAAHGYRVSVSLEPMLEGVLGAFDLIRTIQHILGPQGTVWVGKMNQARSRVDCSVPENLAAVVKIEELQADNRIYELVAMVEIQPELKKIVRWKDSVQQLISEALR